MNKASRIVLPVIALSATLLGAAAPAAAQCPLSFAPPASYPVGSGPGCVATADFNADGVQDLAVANNNGSSVSIYLGIGRGLFQPAPLIAISNPYSVAATDFDADGTIDLAVASWTNGNVAILHGNGDGTFQPAVSYPAAPAGNVSGFASVGDFNADGRPDLAVSNHTTSTVSILLNNPNGTFQPPLSYGVGANPLHVAVGDLDADGALDVAVSNHNSSNVSILLGNGDGSLSAAVQYGAGAGPYSTAIADFNADGKPDLAVSNIVGNSVSILRGNGNGTFLPAIQYTGLLSARRPAVGDFNADGDLDLAVPTANFDSGLAILAGNGDGTFQPPVNFAAAGGSASDVAVADYNSDGRSDLAVTVGGGNNVTVFLNTHSNATAPTITQQPAGVVIVPVGSPAVLSVVVDGGGRPLIYQWRKNGLPIADAGDISGATSPTLVIDPVQLDDSGMYDVIVKTPGCGGGFIAATSASGIIAASVCSADVNGDGKTDGGDLGLLLGAFGSCP